MRKYYKIGVIATLLPTTSASYSPIVSVALFIIIVAVFLFTISFINKFRARTLKNFAEQHGYQFSYEDSSQVIAVTEKCNSTIGLKGKVATNIVTFKENNDSISIFTWGMTQSNYNVCLIETETDFNCHVLILPSLGKFPGAFKAVAAMGVRAIRGLNEVKLNNSEFDKNFTLYTDNKSIALRLLTDEVIRYTLDHLSKFRAGPAIWGLGKNMVAVCSRKLHSAQEIETLVNYSKELKNFLIKK